MQQAKKDLYRYFGTYSPSSEEKTDESFEAFDIGRKQTSGGHSIDIRCLTTEELPAWLGRDLKKHQSSNEPVSCLARIVLADNDSTQSWKSTSEVTQIASYFGLLLAHDYAMSCIAGVAALPPNGVVGTYALVHPKLVAIWSARQPSSQLQPTPDSSHPPTFPTQAIILASASERAGLKKLLNRPWDFSLTSHTMFPAFLCGLIIGHEVDKTQESIKNDMRSVEARTGHHNSASRKQQPANGSWGHLSARMSGFARKLASTSRKIQVARELLNFILAHAKKGAGVGADKDAAELIKHHVELMSRRLEMQRLQNEFLSQKANIQMTAILNLMAREDSSIGLQSAFSMKTLALLALIFLPGSFVAALFSAPLFNWDSVDEADHNSISVGTKPQFSLFWAITIPLTVLSFIFYVGWSLFERRRFEKAQDEECG
ncbi:hypothetical protein DL767_000587 [Monosporascus sp. MG133]|nr:hypothetical protein DL767_000587 [Monosporascus sp. MG133]